MTIAESFTDNDLSAFSGVERPEYERLLASMAAGRIGTLIISHANRLLRNTDAVNPFIRLARAHYDNYVTSGDGGTCITYSGHTSCHAIVISTGSNNLYPQGDSGGPCRNARVMGTISMRPA